MQVEAASLETVRDRAQLATLASYAEQRPAPKREVDVRKLQLKMDPFQQAVEGRQLVLSEPFRGRNQMYGRIRSGRNRVCRIGAGIGSVSRGGLMHGSCLS